jgi:hypothetical protein
MSITGFALRSLSSRRQSKARRASRPEQSQCNCQGTGARMRQDLTDDASGSGRLCGASHSHRPNYGRPRICYLVLIVHALPQEPTHPLVRHSVRNHSGRLVPNG